MRDAGMLVHEASVMLVIGIAVMLLRPTLKIEPVAAAAVPAGIEEYATA